MLAGTEVAWDFIWSNERAVDNRRVQETDMLVGTEVAWDFIWSCETAVDNMRVQETHVGRDRSSVRFYMEL